MTVEPASPTRHRGPLLAAAGLAAVVLAVAGYLAGHASAAGPATLADAVTQAQQGKLPCGDTGSVRLGGGNGAGFGGGGASAGGGGFFLQRLCGGQGQAGAAGAGGAGRGFGGGLFGPGAVNGRITAVRGSKLTIQTRAGALTVTVGSRTAITKTGTGSRSDLKPGLTATVTTTATASGRRNATRIFLLPRPAA
jgi:hypothetical protein